MAPILLSAPLPLLWPPTSPGAQVQAMLGWAGLAALPSPVTVGVPYSSGGNNSISELEPLWNCPSGSAQPGPSPTIFLSGSSSSLRSADHCCVHLDAGAFQFPLLLCQSLLLALSGCHGLAEEHNGRVVCVLMHASPSSKIWCRYLTVPVLP